MPGNSHGQADSSVSPTDEFIRLFTQAQRRLYLFILTQLPHPADAEEALQETNVVIWRKCRQFRPGSSFLAWAMQIARYEILKQRRLGRRNRLVLSNEFAARIADEAEQLTDQLELRREALIHCLRKLSTADRDLIRRRYALGGSGQAVAEALGRPVNSVYQSLGRIRRVLHECINRRLAVQAVP